MRPQLHGRAVRAVSALGAVVITAGAFDSAARAVPLHNRPARGRHSARHTARHPGRRARRRVRRHARVRMRARILHPAVLVGQDVAFVGSTQPVVAGRQVGVQERQAGGWVDVAQTVTDAHGHFSARVWPRQLGAVHLRVRLVGAHGASIPVAGIATVYHAVFASWYGPGGTTACGEALGVSTLGVANRTLPCGTLVTLRYKGRTVRVPVIDRGPFVAGRDYDLTYATKLVLGMGDVSLIWASA